MGHPRRQAADPGQLLDPHRLALCFEQLFGHGAVTVCQVTQLARLVRLRTGRDLASAQGIGLIRETVERREHHPMHQIPAEEHEDCGAAKPQGDQWPPGVGQVPAQKKHRIEADQDDRRRGDESQVDQELGA